KELLVLRLEHDLRDAVTVAQVDKDDRALVAVGVDPAVERDRLADMLFAQLAAGMRSPPMWHLPILLIVPSLRHEPGAAGSPRGDYTHGLRDHPSSTVHRILSWRCPGPLT